MIMALAMQGDEVKAPKLFKCAWVKLGCTHDGVNYLAALCACNHAGMVDDGVKLFESLTVCGLSPSVKHYGSVVDLLGRAGQLEETYEIINSMSVVPVVVLWQMFLGASKTYWNVDMAEKASRKLVEAGSNSCGDFVLLLSNIYAAQERWENVGQAREAMKNRDVKKVPSFSYVEVDGVIYKFVNSDRSHLNWLEIYRKLHDIGFRIKEYGYVAETNYLSHDIGHEEKENVLCYCYHSQKLAVAFGLISTSERSAIQVNKNLKICGT